MPPPPLGAARLRLDGAVETCLGSRARRSIARWDTRRNTLRGSSAERSPADWREIAANQPGSHHACKVAPCEGRSRGVERRGEASRRLGGHSCGGRVGGGRTGSREGVYGAKTATLEHQRRAHQLVTDDAHHSRGLPYASTLLLADHERLTSTTGTRDYELATYPSHKGKARSYNDHDDDDDDGEDDQARASGAWAREAPPPRDAHGHDPTRATRSTTTTRRHSLGAAARPGRARLGGLHAETLDQRRLRILWWRSAAINSLFILAWYCFSTLISLYNKWMFSADHYNFPYPLFVTSVHMLVQWCLSALTLSVFRSLRPQTKPRSRDYATKVAPCGMATGLDIGLSNLSLRTITLSFYTMCKSSSLAFVLIFAFLFRLEVPSWRLVGIILIITSGVVLMVSTETQFDLVGMLQVLSASALGGLRWSLTQLLLHKESMGMNNPVATLFWLAPVMGATLATCSLVFDGWGNVFAHDEFWGSLGASLQTTCAIVFPGVLAFLMNITEFGLIQRTSVVTLSVAGIFKEVITIFLSTVLFHDQLTPINVSGLCVTIFGASTCPPPLSLSLSRSRARTH
ncbi:triose-phosphate transporter family-domain-containing protein [Rhodotorula diobovata]|uniref:Triose-phosphate transporter family-domain-containing protein n=1 Tax=Rhodotorula diobovata TaxID=5288 RepID=A0A5C5FMM8_9BASI|nr:triose-phosphate transporter family-domain-containing protein [Rhodotorula diobovata]